MHSVHSTLESCRANPASDETTSLEHDPTVPFDESHDATNEGLIAYAMYGDIRYDDRGEYKYPNATLASQSFARIDPVDVDLVRQAPPALTQHALQQHNTNVIVDARTANAHPVDEDHTKTISIDGTATYASTLDGNGCPYERVEPYSYPRQSPRLHLPYALAEADDQDPVADAGCLCLSLEYPDHHPYPTYIIEADLDDHHLAGSEFHNNPSNTKSVSTFSISQEDYLQQVSVAYAGIGAQFSS